MLDPTRCPGTPAGAEQLNITFAEWGPMDEKLLSVLLHGKVPTDFQQEHVQSEGELIL